MGLGGEETHTVDTNLTDAEVETAYNNRVSAMSQAEAEAGVDATIKRVTAERIKQAIDALGGGTGNTFARVVKKADETRNNTTTLTIDSELAVSLLANKKYSFIIGFYFSSAQTPDIKYAFTLPSGASGRINGSGWSSGVSTTDDILTIVKLLGASAGGNQMAMITGKIKIDATAGTFGITWAQNTSNASDTTVLEGSWIVIYEEIA